MADFVSCVVSALTVAAPFRISTGFPILRKADLTAAALKRLSCRIKVYYHLHSLSREHPDFPRSSTFLVSLIKNRRDIAA